MLSHSEKLNSGNSKSIADSLSVKKPASEAVSQLPANARESIFQKKLGAANAVPQQSVSPIQRALFHYNGAPFTSAEADAWNALSATATGFGVGAALIASTETDVYSVPQVVTVAASITALKALVRAHILTLQRPRLECDNFNWGDFAPHLLLLAGSYGARTGPVVTGGHAANVYTYTTAGGSEQIAEETNAHGQTPGNLNTRRGAMRRVMDLFNGAVQAHANQYL